MAASHQQILHLGPRTCEICGSRSEAFAYRQWEINFIIPGGKTVLYRCGRCKSEFSLRSRWHLVLLVLLVALLLYVILVAFSRDEVFVVAFAGCVLAYASWALVTDTVARKNNPRWRE